MFFDPAGNLITDPVVKQTRIRQSPARQICDDKLVGKQTKQPLPRLYGAAECSLLFPSADNLHNHAKASIYHTQIINAETNDKTGRQRVRTLLGVLPESALSHKTAHIVCLLFFADFIDAADQILWGSILLMQYQSAAVDPDRIPMAIQPAVIQIVLICLTGTDPVNIVPQNFLVFRIHKLPVASLA